MAQLCGAVEAGGTKFVCAVGTGPDDLRAEARFATTTPEATLAEVVRFLDAQRAKHGDLAAIGAGCFGPLDLDPASKTFGHITSTPKQGWAGTDLGGVLGAALGVPVVVDTDVNAAAFGEWQWGAARGLDTFVYLTVGTGIGGGGMARGELLHGLVHPEMGHLRLPHDRSRDPFEGCCPFHGDCWEGLAAGPALEARWGKPPVNLPSGHPAWELEAEYLALGLANLVCTISPQRLILGGGIMQQEGLFPLVRKRLVQLLNGYIHSPQILEKIDAFVVPPALGARAGILGAIALARGLAERVGP
ncbi:MAG: ROK family protein [Deltaproteobacteria bacterium]|nr:ROK family protein [Deltaproteobacteria bacterium]